MINKIARTNLFVVCLLLGLAFSAFRARADEIDTDRDGFSDAAEIKSGYSPFNTEPVRLDKSDVDGDKLSDFWEIRFKTDPFNPDSDNDGRPDGLEVDNAYNPLSSSTKKLAQRIEIDRKNQKLYYYIQGERWREFPVSTGKPSMPTPAGKFKILNKLPKPWSKSYGLWMPYWLGLGRFGIHELPIWPNGYREGSDHLGKAVSHGCIRLGIGPAQYLYERVEVGTEVIIK